MNNGIIFKGSLKNNKKNGYGIQIWPDGTKYIGNWIDDSATGKGQIAHSDGDSY